MRFQGSKNRTKIDQKTIKKWMQDGDSSWHRFFMDFHRFSEASWSQVGIKNRLKIDAKKHPKNDGKQEASWRRLGGILNDQEVSGERGSLCGRRISGPLMRSLKGRKGGTGGRWPSGVRKSGHPYTGRSKNAVAHKARWRISIVIYIYSYCYL